jgi:hypothetical protein
VAPQDIGVVQEPGCEAPPNQIRRVQTGQAASQIPGAYCFPAKKTDVAEVLLLNTRYREVFISRPNKSIEYIRYLNAFIHYNFKRIFNEPAVIAAPLGNKCRGWAPAERGVRPVNLDRILTLAFKTFGFTTRTFHRFPDRGNSVDEWQALGPRLRLMLST